MLSPRPGWFFSHLIIKILFLTIRKNVFDILTLRNPFKYVFICAHIFYVRRCDFEVGLDVCIHARCVCVCVCVSCSVMSDSLRPTRPLCSWSFPGKNTGVSSYFLLQGIFLTQGLNLGLPHCRQILYHLSHQESRWVYTLMRIFWTVAMKWWYWLV